jgi:toxin ParE1/3/4
MSPLYFSPASGADLEDIFDHISKDNPPAAVEYVDKLKESCNLIAEFPEIGVLRQEIAPSIRCLPVLRYLIFYRSKADVVEIVRIVHSSRDYRKSLS